METFAQMKVHAILKFSHISKILVYYGYLHKWKALMERLNKQSSNIWKDNLDAFIKWGENNKAPIDLLYDSEEAKSFISNINDNYKFIRSIVGNDKSFVKLIHKILNILGDDTLIQLSHLQMYWWDILDLISNHGRSNKSSKFSIPYSILINSKATSHIINCIHLKSQPVYTLNQTDNIDDIFLNSGYMFLCFYNENGEVKYKKIKSKAYSWKDIKESLSKCQDKVWFCKPKRVCDIKIEQIDLLYSEIERGNISQNVNKYLSFDKQFNFSIDESIPNSEDIEKLHKFFGLFKINRESWIQTEKLIINYPKEQRKEGNLRISRGNILLLFEKNMYSVNIWGDSYLRGLLYNPKNKNAVVINLTNLDIKSSKFKKEKDTSLFYLNWLEELKDHDLTDPLNMYAIVYKPHVTEFTSSKLEEIKTISTWENMKVIQIITNGSDEEMNELIDTLKVIPKTLYLEIQWTTDSWFLMDECFWIEIFKRKQIEFMNEGDWKVSINCESQELDKNDILKSIIEVETYRCRIKIPIDQVSDIISITEFEFKNKFKTYLMTYFCSLY